MQYVMPVKLPEMTKDTEFKKDITSRDNIRIYKYLNGSIFGNYINDGGNGYKRKGGYILFLNGTKEEMKSEI